MSSEKEREPIKTDAVSIIVYIVIIVLLYYIIGILLKTGYWFLTLIQVYDFRNDVFVNNPLAIILNIIYEFIYSMPAMMMIHSIFMIVLVLVVVIYVIWSVLKDVFIIGSIIRSSFPFKQFDEEGIFRLIDNILIYISRILPKNALKAILLIYLEMLIFAKSRIINFIKLANPEATVNGKEFDEFVARVKESSGVETFENKKKPTNIFFETTEKSIEQKGIADSYKTSISVKPNMDIVDRLSISFQNEMNKIKAPINNIESTVTNEVSKTLYNVE